MNYKDTIINSNNQCRNHYIRETQITLRDVLEHLASGITESELLSKFPYLSKDDIFACLVYGADGEAVSKQIQDLQYQLLMKKTAEERVAIAGEMFAFNRRKILNSLPKDLSENEVKKQLYFRTYGEHPPEDFFDRKQRS
jgi:uncharacterized protein (DUF433 family)